MATEKRAESRTVSVRYAAAQLGIGGSTLYRLIRDGRCPLPVLHLGERVVIPREGLERALDGRATQVQGSAPDLGRWARSASHAPLNGH